MNYNLFCCSLVVLTFIFTILPQTLAPWKVYNPPNTPLPNEYDTCAGWLVYNRFHPQNTQLNQQLAREYRDPKLDTKAFVWSVGYAYIMSGLNTLNLTPLEFCHNRGMPYNFQMQHLSLENTKLKCPEWIYLYGYELEQYNQNWDRARFRDFNADNEISHWVASYGKFLSSLNLQVHGTGAAMSPATFCTGLGIRGERKLPFMKRSVALYSCTLWLKVHGFTDNLFSNFFKAQQGFHEMFLDQIHYLAKQFVIELNNRGRNNGIKPSDYCAENNMGSRTPIQFYSILHQ